MIGAQEFILFYNELFNVLYEKYGREGPVKLWKKISEESDYIRSLDNLVKNKDIEGIKEHWSGNIEHEGGRGVATLYEDEFVLDWHRCPSVAKLRKTHVRPYKYYCDHCVFLYHPTLNKHGFLAKRHILDRELGECRFHVKRKKGKNG